MIVPRSIPPHPAAHNRTVSGHSRPGRTARVGLQQAGFPLRGKLGSLRSPQLCRALPRAAAASLALAAPGPAASCLTCRVMHAACPAHGPLRRRAGRPRAWRPTACAAPPCRRSGSPRPSSTRSRRSPTRHGLSVSALVRRIVLGRRLPQPVPRVNLRAWAKLGPLAGNLNQYMKAINQGRAGGVPCPCSSTSASSSTISATSCAGGRRSWFRASLTRAAASAAPSTTTSSPPSSRSCSAAPCAARTPAPWPRSSATGAP